MANATNVKKLKTMYLYDWFNYAFIGLITLSFLYPLILNLSISLSDGNDPLARITLLPMGFNLESYRFLLADGRVFRYYFNSVVYSTGRTFFHLLFTSLMAFPFIIADFRGKTFLNIFMLITMFFGGGLIPYFFVVRAMGLVDSPWVMMIPGTVSAFQVIIFRTFFQNIPAELRESAYVDGSGHWRVLFQIMMPVSKALLATFGLFSIVGVWNDWFTPMLFLRRGELMPIQIFLRRLLILMDFRDAENVDVQMMFNLVTSRTIRSAAVMITIAPVLCVYPFLQKHFTKGVMIGSIKG
ncbi:MAG: carbohydrate ABC transporter permease [Defluviitaleaceae bacterium]|nr:carbohydrate ABC transporter permease [Defluviitaleaceae bacterium]